MNLIRINYEIDTNKKLADLFWPIRHTYCSFWHVWSQAFSGDFNVYRQSEVVAAFAESEFPIKSLSVPAKLFIRTYFESTNDTTYSNL